MKKFFFTITLCLVWTGLGWAHGDISMLPPSVQIMQYKLVLYMDPDDHAARNKLGLVLYKTNQMEEAEKEFDYILEKDGSNFDALDGLGIVLIKMGKYQEALQHLDKAMGINDQDVMVHVHLSAVYQKMKLPEKAEKELTMARSLAADQKQLEKIEAELKTVSGP